MTRYGQRTQNSAPDIPVGRLVFIDTETTGLKHEDGHVIVEIGALEMIDRSLTGRTFHAYLNPAREMSDETMRIHGLTNALLAVQPAFREIADSLMAFVQGSTVIAHNAPFDIGFLDAEMRRAGRGKQAFSSVVPSCDTLAYAKTNISSQGYSLDALCRKFGISLASRKVHGALIDAWLLAKLWLAMTAGQQALPLERPAEIAPVRKLTADHAMKRPRVLRASEEELAAHKAIMAKMDVPDFFAGDDQPFAEPA